MSGFLSPPVVIVFIAVYICAMIMAFTQRGK